MTTDLLPVSLLAAVDVDRDGVLVGADHSLHIVLLKSRGEIRKGVGPILWVAAVISLYVWVNELLLFSTCEHVSCYCSVCVVEWTVTVLYI